LLASHLIAVAAATALSVLATQGALAQKKYDTGATDTEIKIGKTEDAYFRMINDQGGINGRKINFISYDDGYTARRRRWSRSAS
jgi:branched-chain amino acid transport system substrate-binding protein